MKKILIFDFATLFVIAAGFFVLLYLKNPDKSAMEQAVSEKEELLVYQAEAENEEYARLSEEADEKENELSSEQAFSQPLAEEFHNCYCYSVLNDEEQKVYEEIYNILINLYSDVELSTLDVNLVEKAFKCVLNDHPEIYYVEGYTYTTYSKQDVLSKLEFSGTYTKTAGEKEEIDKKIEQYTDRCFSGITREMSDYEKVRYLYDYIIKETEYDLNSPESQNICSVFLYGDSVCMGYAKAMQYLLLKQDIMCTLVNGTAKKGEAHAWNLLLLDGQYYHLDVTWGDDSYVEADGISQTHGVTNYSYFCVTTEEILKSHKIDNVVSLPECTAIEDNYYVKEGCYFEEMDLEKLDKIFKEAYLSSANDFVEIKCKDITLYNEFVSYLIDEQHIFDYLIDGKDTVSYYEGEDILLLEFWVK